LWAHLPKAQVNFCYHLASIVCLSSIVCSKLLHLNLNILILSNFNSSYMAMSSSTYIPGLSPNIPFSPFIRLTQISHIFYKRSHLNLLLGNLWTEINKIWQK
jgi:hypothetical protein